MDPVGTGDVVFLAEMLNRPRAVGCLALVLLPFWSLLQWLSHQVVSMVFGIFKPEVEKIAQPNPEPLAFTDLLKGKTHGVAWWPFHTASPRCSPAFSFSVE